LREFFSGGPGEANSRSVTHLWALRSSVVPVPRIAVRPARRAL